MAEARGTFVRLGYEVGTGKEINVPLLNLAVTGQTQESGKTTTLEALATRSGAKVITFVTKRGESSFATGRRVQPYFRDRADWQFVDAILEAALGEKNKFLRQFLIPICRTTKTLAEVQDAVRQGLNTAKGIREGALVQLDAYLDLIVPDIARANLAPALDIRSGLNVMDVSDFSTPMQMLFVQSAIDWINDRERNTVVVIPEAWEFIPEGKGSPVKAAAVKLVRKGSGIGNRIWVDSQDMAGVDKTILRGCPVWLIGVQREFNEIKRNIANIPPPTGKPKPGDVAMLERGQFFACFGKTLAKVYVQPAWMKEDQAKRIATGVQHVDFAVRPKAEILPLTEGYVVKGGRNQGPSQIKERPAPPAPMKKPKQEAEVDEKEARALRAENDDLKRQIKELTRRLDGKEVSGRRGEPAGDKVEGLAVPYADDFYVEFKRRLLEDGDPAVIRLLQSKPEITVTVERKTIDMDESKLIGRLAAMIAGGFFDSATTASAAFTDLQRRGKGSAKPNVYKACDELTTLGFLTKGSGGYKAVDGMKVNIVEA